MATRGRVLAPPSALLYSISMRVLIATGIFEPEVGGPATYAPRLARQFVSAVNSVAVITYSATPSKDSDKDYPFKLVRIVRGNRILNRIRFFFAAYREAKKCDLVYTLDWFAAGLPVALAAKLLGKPYVVRVGGDYLWEQKYLESGQKPLTLREFYTSGIYRRSGYAISFRLIRFVLSGARHVIFNSNPQRELYIRFYGLAPARVSTIFNPVPELSFTTTDDTPRKNEFVYWGRFIVMKNLGSLIRAFAQARLPEGYTLALIGDGPRQGELEQLVKDLGFEKRVIFERSLLRDQVLQRIKDSHAFVLPSWTDISPNQVAEALALGLPGLVTGENYLSISGRLPETLDPHSVEDIATKLEKLADDGYYRDYVKKWRAISFSHDWNAVYREHKYLFEKIVRV